MIEIPVHNQNGQKVDSVKVDEQLLGGEVRPVLLKQAFVRMHANRRQGSAATKGRGEVEGSTRKLYRQKGTGNARRGAIRTNILRGGGVAFAKKARSFRQGMPKKMRRLANYNALLAKVLDGEVKVIDKFDFDKPSTKAFVKLLEELKIDRSCVVGLCDTRDNTARSAVNVDRVSIRRADQLNVFDLLNHRYVMVEKAGLDALLQKAAERCSAGSQEAA